MFSGKQIGFKHVLEFLISLMSGGVSSFALFPSGNVVIFYGNSDHRQNTKLP